MKCEPQTKELDQVALGKALPLMESFYTIQGEGYYQGESAYFIRLAGCDVGCHWCDVKDSWDASLHPVVEVDDIVAQVVSSAADKVVVTGGEPLMHNNDYLCRQFGKFGIRRHIETSGAYPISGEWDWICFSPKKFKKPIEQVAKSADELKVVIYNKSDFQWAESFRPLVSNKCRLYLQPEWSKRDKITPEIVQYVKRNPQWAISLQVHKYIDVP